MADARLTIGLDPEDRVAAEHALATLARLGCLERYALMRYTEVAENARHQTDQELFESIRRVQASTQGLMDLHHYGLELAQELEGNDNAES